MNVQWPNVRSVLQKTWTKSQCKLCCANRAPVQEYHPATITVPRTNIVMNRVHKTGIGSPTARYCHDEPTQSRKRPRFDRIGYQHEDKIQTIRDKLDINFSTDEFFRGVAASFLRVTNYINDNNDADLEPLLSLGALKYAQWVRDESTHDDSCYNEVIFPVVERDIFSLVVNNVEIDGEILEDDFVGNSTVDITVTITYGKNHRVIFGIPDSYLCSFAIFKFQRTFVGRTDVSDWTIDRIQYYPPR